MAQKSIILDVISDDVSAVTLKRTDTTLDLSQMAKRYGRLKMGVGARLLI